MAILTKFDPWKSQLCTCPPKYSLSPYTGCSHACRYCYITAYIPRAFSCRPKTDFQARLRREISGVNPPLPICIASSSDPYVPMEAKLRLTRDALIFLLEKGLKVLLITKSSLVTRDIDIIRKGNCSVSITITTTDNKTSSKLEPLASLPSARVKAIKKLASASIPCSVRIDPIIPGVNDDPEMLENLILKIAESGAKQVICSTYKAKADSLKRVLREFPDLSVKLKQLYLVDGEAKGRVKYLPATLRLHILKGLREQAEKQALDYPTCREEFKNLGNAETCDATHLIPNGKDIQGCIIN